MILMLSEDPNDHQREKSFRLILYAVQYRPQLLTGRADVVPLRMKQSLEKKQQQILGRTRCQRTCVTFIDY